VDGVSGDYLTKSDVWLALGANYGCVGVFFACVFRHQSMNERE
jgi:hypothetical protein